MPPRGADEGIGRPDAGAAIEAAPAKINLALHVTGRRKDGYHLLDTLVVFAAEGDILRATPGEADTTLTLEGPFAPALEAEAPADGNLVMRAAKALAESKRGSRPPLRLRLEKRLPIAAGLGGGSADAAAALRLLNRQWRLDLSHDKLAKLGAGLGADVPMCLSSEPLRATGIGEKLALLPGLPAIWVLLVNPGVPVSTKAVFERLKTPADPPLPTPPKAFRTIFDLVMWLRATRNGLEEAAKAEAKPVARVLAALGADPECLLARMSGSGGTCFGIFASQSAAQRAAVRLRIARPDWWVAASVTGGS